MGYRVLTAFMDLQDRGYGYCTGDTYPRNGLEPTEERIVELSKHQNKRGMPLIKYEEETDAEEEILKEEVQEPEKRSTKKEG